MRELTIRPTKRSLKQVTRSGMKKNKWYYNEYRKKRRAGNGEGTYGRHVLYSVWNNYTDELVILDGKYVFLTREEAEAKLKEGAE